MKRLFKYIKKYKYQSILGPLFKLLEAVLELIVPLVVADIIDVGIKSGDTRYIVARVGLLCLLAAVGFGFAITAQYFAARAAVGCATAIRHDLFKKITGLSYSRIDENGTSTLMTRLTGDVNLVQTGINMVLRLMLRSPLVVAGATIMAFTIDKKLTIIFLAVIAALYLVVTLITKTTVPMYKGIQGRLDVILRKTKENLSGARVIRAFVLADEEEQSFRQEIESLNVAQRVAGRVAAVLNPATYCIVNLGIIALIYFGAIHVDNSVISQGSLVALYNYMSQILVELVKFAGLIVTFNKSVASVARINSVLDIEDEPTADRRTDNPDFASSKVAFDGVSFRYGDVEEYALSDVSFTADKGERIGVIGGTGSGKTTLVNLIPAFYKASKGHVYIDGVDVSTYTESELGKIVKVVPQKAVLFSGTIRDNLMWGDESADERTLERAVEASQSSDVIRAKENGLDSPVEQGGANFSGGQRQRLTIARALVGEPQVLILDDSASALDYATDAALRTALKDSYKDSTVFIVSQRTSSVMGCNKIIVLDDGNVCGIGTHDELLQNCEKYREIYDSQYKKEAK